MIILTFSLLFSTSCFFNLSFSLTVYFLFWLFSSYFFSISTFSSCSLSLTYLYIFLLVFLTSLSTNLLPVCVQSVVVLCLLPTSLSHLSLSALQFHFSSVVICVSHSPTPRHVSLMQPSRLASPAGLDEDNYLG